MLISCRCSRVSVWKRRMEEPEEKAIQTPLPALTMCVTLASSSGWASKVCWEGEREQDRGGGEPKGSRQYNQPGVLHNPKKGLGLDLLAVLPSRGGLWGAPLEGTLKSISLNWGGGEGSGVQNGELKPLTSFLSPARSGLQLEARLPFWPQQIQGRRTWRRTL